MLNFAIKEELKDDTSVYGSNLATKSNLIALKPEVGKQNINILLNVRTIL